MSQGSLERILLRLMENNTLEEQRRRAQAESLLKIPFYSADPGRLGTYGNTTGQPAVLNNRGEGMYPSSARTRGVGNTSGSTVLPQTIPADLDAILELIRQGVIK